MSPGPLGESTGYFLRRLAAAGIDPETCYITTAHKEWIDTEDEMHMLLKLEVETLQPKMVCALGRKAEKMLLKVKDISYLSWFEVLPHPSFWQNFYRDNDKEYEYLLKNLSNKITIPQVV